MVNKSNIVLLTLLGLLHVFVFSAAFPFFNVVDEQVHLDLVVHYSKGDIPRSLAPPENETLPFVAIYGTPEYLTTLGGLPGGFIPVPPWKNSNPEIFNKLLDKETAYRTVFKNHEASQPPLYYTIAGGWWRLGKLMGLDGGHLLYWLRFLNLVFVVLLIWVAAYAAAKMFPENRFMAVAVPAFVALMPQTAFYSINNDVLCPLLFGLVFVLLFQFHEKEIPTPILSFGLGLALAGTFLTKISNVPLLAVAALFVVMKILRIVWRGKLTASLPPLALMAAAALLPMAAWMVWCKKNFGDLTGSALKIHFLGWTEKPFGEWFHHPLFTLHGFRIFLSGNLTTFWQGEFLWQGHPLAIHGLNRFYVWTTLVLLLVAAIAYFVPRTGLTPPQRFIVRFSFACVLAAFAFFALLSVKYDFHDCFYPSSIHPYFTSGRLMLGMLVPFLMLFALGLDRLLGRTGHNFKITVLVLLLAFMVCSEITVDWKIFTNNYNWFHM